MVGSNSSKILTVSYGTFSCTLEGFDDPFSTMRHIAEYFRDLAADDRYFGAEPPTPDAEMLHRIAEREIQRRVEARVTGENVVLRQLDTGLAEDEAEETSSSVMGAGAAARAPGRASHERSEEDEPEETRVPETVQAETPEPAHAEDLEKEAPLDPRAGSIEEKLSRIRAVVERTRSRDLGAGLANVVTEQDDADDEAMVADMSPGFAGDIDAVLISQVMAEQAAGDDRMPEEDAATTAETVWDFDETAAEAAADVETSADKTAANEDTGQADADAGPGASAGDEPAVESDEQEDVSEPVHDEAEDEAADSGDMPDEPLSAASDESDSAEEDAAAETDTDTDAAIARIMGEDMPAEEEFSSSEDDRQPLRADEPEVQGEVEPEIEFEMDAAEDDGAPETDETAAGDVTGTDEDASTEEKLQEAKTARAETGEAPKGSDAGDEDGDEDEFWDVDFDAEARAEAAANADEEHGRPLDLEKDATEWHADAEADSAPKGATTLADARAERSLSKSSQLRAPEEESARIVSRTETAFSENEGTRRRSAIAHLKAAVAATRADKILSRVVGWDRAGDPEEQKDYREDLSNIVKPRKTSEILEFESPEQGASKDERDEDVASAEPVDETTLDITLDDDGQDEGQDEAPARRTTSRVKTRLLGPEDTVSETAFADGGSEDGTPAETTGGERASPLMLVSELRVDRDGGSPVRPRRVSREVTGEEGAEDGKGFAEFVERMGANDLTDLMEAAAAYTAFVEGQPHFSRPQIMRRVANVDPTIEDSREAGLRSFGQLLRQGRIQKLQRGQFTVSQSSRFKPERQIAGE